MTKFRLIFLTSLIAAPLHAAETCTVPAEAARPLNHTLLYIEDNAGDGDLGVHGYFDDDGWQELCVFDPAGALILHALPAGRMGELGIAGVFFESREPEYDDLDYAALQAAWPEGDYAARALGWDGEILGGAAHFTTLVPLPPEIVTPATVPEDDEGDLPVVPVADLKVEWKPVTASRDGRVPVITAYQVIVEKQNHDDPHGFSRPAFDLHVRPGTTSVIVPAAFFDPSSVYEIEVLVIEESGNQTIGGASFFATE